MFTRPRCRHLSRKIAVKLAKPLLLCHLVPNKQLESLTSSLRASQTAFHAIRLLENHHKSEGFTSSGSSSNSISSNRVSVVISSREILTRLQNLCFSFSPPTLFVLHSLCLTLSHCFSVLHSLCLTLSLSYTLSLFLCLSISSLPRLSFNLER